MSSLRNLQSQKFIERRKKKMQALVFLCTLAFFTLSATGILFLRSSFIQVQKVSVKGTTIVPEKAIEASALSALSGSYFNVIPHSSIFFVSKRRIREALSKEYAEINNFTISRSGLSKITISLKERTPVAIVCSGFREEGDENDCFVSDSSGYVFSSASTTVLANAADFNHYYVPTDKGDITPGTNFVVESRFKELEKFLLGARRAGLLPLGVLVGDNGEYEMYLKNKKGESEATVYFDDRAPFDTTLTNLLTFWNNPSEKRSATTTQSFDYINLRFGNTVYYSTE